MTDVFLKLLNISITASWIVLVVVLLRLLLRKTPKWIFCLLWGIVALRLIMPFTVESHISLVPNVVVSRQQVEQPLSSAEQVVPPSENSEQATQEAPQVQSPSFHYWEAVSIAWLSGMAGMLLYSVASYFRLRYKVRISIQIRKGTYLCDEIDTPFILGLFRPRIYVPSGLSEDHLQYVMAHEHAHIRRKDHWWKPFGFLLLSVYWFNPLLWLAYILLCRDIEQACDEKAVSGMDITDKKHYSEALIACSVSRRSVSACPVAFGEVAVKSRIKGVVNYKKPAFWIVAVSVTVCAVTAVCFLTDPKSCQHDYRSQITVQSSCTQAGTEQFTCAKCEDSYTVSLPCVAHSYDGGTVTVPPTCVQTGTREVTCTACGYRHAEAIGTTAHTAGQITILKEASCTEKGLMSATCAVCNVTFQEELPTDSQVHDMNETVVRAATCGSTGEGALTCSHCGYSESVTYPLLSHHFVDYGLIRKTCYSHIRQQICTGCNVVKKVELADYGHNWANGRCSVCFTTKPNDATALSYPTEP